MLCLGFADLNILADLSARLLLDDVSFLNDFFWGARARLDLTSFKAIRFKRHDQLKIECDCHSTLERGLFWTRDMLVPFLFSALVSTSDARSCEALLEQTDSAPHLSFVNPIPFEILLKAKKGFTRQAVAYGFFDRGNRAVTEWVKIQESSRESA